MTMLLLLTRGLQKSEAVTAKKKLFTTAKVPVISKDLDNNIPFSFLKSPMTISLNVREASTLHIVLNILMKIGQIARKTHGLAA